MRFIYRLAFLVFVSLFFSQCQKGPGYIGVGDPGQVVPPSPLQANLQGNVLDEYGQAAINVSVTVGSIVTTTDAKGYFRINNASLDKNAALVTAKKAGYFTAFRSFSTTTGTNQVVIKLIKKNLAGSVIAANGGSVSLSNGTNISLPANGIVTASDNSIYTGTVNVFVAYIDPTASDIFDKVPGSFMGNDKDGKRVLLSSYGMVSVELEGTSGEKLQIKSGNTATLTSPIPSSAQASAPATIPLWYVDETTGLWKEEGAATKQGNNYVGTVKHFTYWNFDLAAQTVMLSAIFKTGVGQPPLINAQIVIKPANGNYYGGIYGYTDSLGQINGPIPANMSLVMQVLDRCNTPVYTQNIGPFKENTDLGAITVSSSSANVVTLKGKLTNCSGTNVTNGYAILSVNNMVRYAKVDGSGNFSTNYILCNASSPNVTVLGVDESTQQQGNAMTLPISGGTTELGNILACGNSSAQYFNYKYDGINYALSNTPGDSLVIFTGVIGPDKDTLTTIYAFNTNKTDYLQIYVHQTHLAPGTYPVSYIQMNNDGTTKVNPNISVTFTRFPVVRGDFFEATFSGTIDGTYTGNHTISGTFRMQMKH